MEAGFTSRASSARGPSLRSTCPAPEVRFRSRGAGCFDRVPDSSNEPVPASGSLAHLMTRGRSIGVPLLLVHLGPCPWSHVLLRPELLAAPEGSRLVHAVVDLATTASTAVCPLCGS